MNVCDRVAELFGSRGLLCAESVLTALCERFGIDSGCVPRAASGFCSGVARTSGMCGALSGAVLAAGLLAGRDSGEDDLEPVYALTQQLVAEFTETFGTVNCRELTGVDFATAEGQARFKAEGMKDAKCIPFAKAAAEIAERAFVEAGYGE